VTFFFVFLSHNNATLVELASFPDNPIMAWPGTWTIPEELAGTKGQPQEPQTIPRELGRIGDSPVDVTSLRKRIADLEAQLRQSQASCNGYRQQLETEKQRNQKPPRYCTGCGQDLNKVMYCRCEQNDYP
jgi:hypothetical protein